MTAVIGLNLLIEIIKKKLTQKGRCSMGKGKSVKHSELKEILEQLKREIGMNTMKIANGQAAIAIQEHSNPLLQLIAELRYKCDATREYAEFTDKRASSRFKAEDKKIRHAAIFGKSEIEEMKDIADSLSNLEATISGAPRGINPIKEKLDSLRVYPEQEADKPLYAHAVEGTSILCPECGDKMDLTNTFARTAIWCLNSDCALFRDRFKIPGKIKLERL